MMTGPANKNSKPVGYCSPPEHTQFKPGQSGNPKGRKKAPPSIVELIAREARLLVPASTENGTKKLSKDQVLVKVLYQKASKGDLQALKLIFTALQVSNEQPADRDEPPLSEAEIQLLAMMMGKQSETEKP